MYVIIDFVRSDISKSKYNDKKKYPVFFWKICIY